MDESKLFIAIFSGLIAISNTIIIVMSKRKKDIYTEIKKDIEKIENSLTECMEKISYLQGRLNGKKNN